MTNVNAPAKTLNRQGGGENNAEVSSAAIAASLGLKAGHLKVSRLCILVASAVHKARRWTGAQPGTPCVAARRLPRIGRLLAAAVWFAYASSSVVVCHPRAHCFDTAKTAVTFSRSCHNWTAEQMHVVHCLLCALPIDIVLMHCLLQSTVCSDLALT